MRAEAWRLIDEPTAVTWWDAGGPSEGQDTRWHGLWTGSLWSLFLNSHHLLPFTAIHVFAIVADQLECPNPCPFHQAALPPGMSHLLQVLRHHCLLITLLLLPRAVLSCSLSN